ncbi:MAG: YlxR family protein [Clostridiales bacterium]|jgi:predicted RNA-binding protein YlxR (DUF448 family)|nr:YlxR family protein [Clostridiales bacterium]
MREVLRKCAVCGGMKDKKELLRAARTGKSFFIDLSGKGGGRGAYICREGPCRETAKKRRALERSFKSPVPAEIYEKVVSV